MVRVVAPSVNKFSISQCIISSLMSWDEMVFIDRIIGPEHHTTQPTGVILLT
jgi:hypothetical protein